MKERSYWHLIVRACKTAGFLDLFRLSRASGDHVSTISNSGPFVLFHALTIA
jgi:hypothetical protein